MPWLKIDYTLKRKASSEYARDYDERLAQPMPEVVYGAAARFQVVGSERHTVWGSRVVKFEFVCG